MFANNKNLKNTSKIYVDLGYYEELENINKQEIEELKEKNKNLNWYFENQKDNFVHKDKIKAKIEEIENYYRELYKQDNSPNEFLIGQDCLSKLSILQEVKQSLLEKE